MIQGSTVRAVKGRDDVVVWQITSSSQLTSPSAVTRCVIICKKDGESDVTIDSSQVPLAFEYLTSDVVGGRAVFSLKWIPGIAIGEQFQESGNWNCSVFLYDVAHAAGVLYGNFSLMVKVTE